MAKVSPPCFQPLSHEELRKRLNMFLKWRTRGKSFRCHRESILAQRHHQSLVSSFFSPQICAWLFFCPSFHMSVFSGCFFFSWSGCQFFSFTLINWFSINSLPSNFFFQSCHYFCITSDTFSIFGSVPLLLFSLPSYLSMDLIFFFYFFFFLVLLFCPVHFPKLFHFFLLPFQKFSLLFIHQWRQVSNSDMPSKKKSKLWSTGIKIHFQNILLDRRKIFTKVTKFHNEHLISTISISSYPALAGGLD